MESNLKRDILCTNINAARNIMDDYILNLHDVLDFIIDNDSTQYLILKHFVTMIEVHYSQLDKFISDLVVAHYGVKGDHDET